MSVELFRTQWIKTHSIKSCCYYYSGTHCQDTTDFCPLFAIKRMMLLAKSWVWKFMWNLLLNGCYLCFTIPFTIMVAAPGAFPVWLYFHDFFLSFTFTPSRSSKKNLLSTRVLYGAGVHKQNLCRDLTCLRHLASTSGLRIFRPIGSRI